VIRRGAEMGCAMFRNQMILDRMTPRLGDDVMAAILAAE
jgi:hypothetical protein